MIKVKNDQNKYKIDLSKWRIHMKQLLVASILLNLGLLAVHILSVHALIIYSNDVFLQSDLDSSYAFNITSLLALFITYPGAVIYYCTEDRKSEEKKNDKYISITAMSITINVIYLGYHFMPYMLLAFIYHPLQAFVTYLLLLFYVLPTMYFILVFVKHACKRCCRSQRCCKSQGNQENDKLSEEQKALNVLVGYSPFLFSIFVYFTIVIIYILTSGNFSDFEVIGNVIPSLLIAMFTYLVVNVKKQAKQKFNLGWKVQDHEENSGILETAV